MHLSPTSWNLNLGLPTENGEINLFFLGVYENFSFTTHQSCLWDLQLIHKMLASDSAMNLMTPLAGFPQQQITLKRTDVKFRTCWSKLQDRHPQIVRNAKQSLKLFDLVLLLSRKAGSLHNWRKFRPSFIKKQMSSWLHQLPLLFERFFSLGKLSWMHSLAFRRLYHKVLDLNWSSLSGSELLLLQYNKFTQCLGVWLWSEAQSQEGCRKKVF